jgi:acetyltransferase
MEIRDTLADVELRQIRPSDAAGLERFYAGLSDQSRWYRFLGATRGLTHVQSNVFCSADHAHQKGFVAVLDLRGRAKEIIGHVCLMPTGRTTAEIAIAVADAWQGRGLGRRLMLAAIEWAVEAGILRLDATMAATNARIHRLLAGLGWPFSMRVSGGLTAISLDLSSHAQEAA